MNIIETTVKPTPPPRTFSIELTENELMNLALILGTHRPADIRNIIDNNHWEAKEFPGIKYESGQGMYDTISAILKKKQS